MDESQNIKSEGNGEMNGTYYINKLAGINRDTSRFNMAPHWLWGLRNGYIQLDEDKNAYIVQRNGVSKKNTNYLHSTDTKIRYITEAKWDSGGVNLVVRAYDGWYKYNTTSGDFDAIDTGRTVDAKGQAAMWNNKFIMVDGGTPRIADSSWTVSDLSSDAQMPTDATAVHIHQSRVWLNSTSNPMIAYGCAVQDETDWSTASDSVQLDLRYILPEGDRILGFRTIGDTMLVIFLQNNIVIYNAPATYDDISLQQVINIGCLSNYSITQLGNDWIFANKSGIKSLSSSLALQKLDLKDLSQTISSFYRSNVSNCVDEEGIYGAYYSKLGHYYYIIRTSNTKMFVYSPEIGNIVGWFTFPFTPISVYEAQDGTFYIGADNGYVYYFDSNAYTDEGETIPLEIEYPFLGIDYPDRYKAPRELELLIKTYTDVDLSVDYWFPKDEGQGDTLTLSHETSGSLWDEASWDEATWDSVDTVSLKSYDLIGRGRLIGLKISNNTNNSRIELYNVLLKTILEGTK